MAQVLARGAQALRGGPRRGVAEGDERGVERLRRPLPEDPTEPPDEGLPGAQRTLQEIERGLERRAAGLRDAGAQDEVEVRHPDALERLHDMKDRHPLIGDVRGRGLLIGIELVADRVSKTPAGDAAEAVLYAAMFRGLSFKTTMGNVLTLSLIHISEPTRPY